MPTYIINATFTLETEIEVEGVDLARQWDWSDAVEGEEVEDTSYFRSSSIEADGGELRFAVEATDEYEAESKAGTIIFDGQEVEDDNSLTWAITNVSFEVSLKEPEMDKERAKMLVTAFISAFAEGGKLTDEMAEAFRFLLEAL